MQLGPKSHLFHIYFIFISYLHICTFAHVHTHFIFISYYVHISGHILFHIIDRTHILNLCEPYHLQYKCTDPSEYLARLVLSARLKNITCEESNLTINLKNTNFQTVFFWWANDSHTPCEYFAPY